MRQRAHRSLLVDGLKAVAAMLIVLHHLAFYGPMADHLRPVVPQLWQWLVDDARMAVQVFLVVGGFLAARSLAPAGRLMVDAGLGATLRLRFLRLALPYYLVLLVAIACNELARGWMTHPSISAPPTLLQLLAHALLLHDLLGYEALSAGLWYVAIDMQLFLLMAVLLWLGEQVDRGRRRPSRPGQVPYTPLMTTALLLVSALGLASLLHFNRDFGWDAWGVYFFGAYALGALAWWASTWPRPLCCLAAMAALTIGILLLEFRERLLLALLVALALGLEASIARRRGTPLPARLGGAGPEQDDAAASRHPMVFVRNSLERSIQGACAISYALFLIHFPVCLVVNAAFTRFMPPNAGWQAIGLFVALSMSVAAAAAFHAGVEVRLHRLLARPRADSMAHAPPVS